MFDSVKDFTDRLEHTIITVGGLISLGLWVVPIVVAVLVTEASVFIKCCLILLFLTFAYFFSWVGVGLAIFSMFSNR